MADFGFDSAFLERLERLTLLNRRSVIGPSSGARRSPRHGSSVEFSDFREYVPGDDYRRIDWKAYARLERVFLRLYRSEDVTTITLLLDRSASMSFGTPPKAQVAAQLAAIFAFVALHSYDRVGVVGWSTGIDHRLTPQAGKTLVPAVWRTIAELMSQPSTRTDFAALRDLASFQRGPGLAIILSDFLTDSDWQGGLRAVRAVAGEVSVIQILAPEEIDPTLRGDWTFQDAETGALVDVTVTPRLIREYKEQLAAHTAAIRDFCRREGIAFVQIPSDISVTESALSSLKSVGIVA